MSAPTAILLPFTFDHAKLAEEILQLPPEAFSEVMSSHISNGGLLACHLLIPDPQKARLQVYELVQSHWLESAPYLQEVLAMFPSEKHIARIHRLQPFAKIKEHIDGNLNYHNEYLRVHLPVTTGPGAHFVLNDTPLSMAAGECWALNVGLPHHVANNSPGERIHIVMDCKRNAWWEELLKSLGHDQKRENQYSRMDLGQLQEMKSLMERLDGEGSKQALLALNAEIEARASS